jgi:hypothetical protein
MLGNMTSLKRPFDSLGQTSTLDDGHHQYIQHSSLDPLYHGDSAHAGHNSPDWYSVLGDVIGNAPFDAGDIASRSERRSNEQIISSVNNVDDEFQLWPFDDLGIFDNDFRIDLCSQPTATGESPEPAFNVCYGMVSQVRFLTVYLNERVLVEICSAGQNSAAYLMEALATYV